MAWVSQSEYRAAGEILTTVRRQAGVSQDELAALLGKPQSFVSSYERGQRRIDVLELARIAAALKFDPGVLFKQLVRVTENMPK